MRILEVKIHNFRCYEYEVFLPVPGINVLYGLNGQGKTSAIEAISLACSSRSFRAVKIGEMLKHGQKCGYVDISVENSETRSNLAVRLQENRKLFLLNGKPCRYLSQYLASLATVAFSPQDLEIIRGAPSNRRLWLDEVSFLSNRASLDTVSLFSKTLTQRNRLLKTLSERSGGSCKKPSDELRSWTDQLRIYSTKVVHNRLLSLSQIWPVVLDFYREISGKNQSITFEYQSSLLSEGFNGQASIPSLEQLDQAFNQECCAVESKELLLGQSLLGAHKDELEVRLEGQPIRTSGSQGEIRSLVLAMRLAEGKTFEIQTSRSPILLVDDFSSELDAKRREYLLQYLQRSKAQVFLTTTERLGFGKNHQVANFRIFSGHEDRHQHYDHEPTV